MNSKLNVIEHSCSDFNIQFTSNKPKQIKNENQFQVQVQQNGDQAKKTRSVNFFFVVYGAFFGLELITVMFSGPDSRVKITWRLQKKLYRASFFWPGHHFVELETDFHFLICFGLFEVN